MTECISEVKVSEWFYRTNYLGLLKKNEASKDLIRPTNEKAYKLDSDFLSDP